MNKVTLKARCSEVAWINFLHALILSDRDIEIETHFWGIEGAHEGILVMRSPMRSWDALDCLIFVGGRLAVTPIGYSWEEA